MELQASKEVSADDAFVGARDEHAEDFAGKLRNYHGSGMEDRGSGTKLDRKRLQLKGPGRQDGTAAHKQVIGQGGQTGSTMGGGPRRYDEKPYGFDRSREKRGAHLSSHPLGAALGKKIEELVDTEGLEDDGEERDWGTRRNERATEEAKFGSAA